MRLNGLKRMGISNTKSGWHRLDTKRSKYVFWFAILLVMFSFLKSFDQTFNGLFDCSVRACCFSLFFFFFWLTAWTVSSYSFEAIDRAIKQKANPVAGITIISFVVLLASAGFAILFDYAYRTIDVHFFGMAEVWNQTPFPHPDLVYPFVLLSLFIFVVERFAGFSLKLKDAELYTAHLEQENIRTKYDALKNQIDPHFFFNSLSVLSSLVHTDPELSSDYILNLSKLYRNILESKPNNIVTLREELEFLNSYIFLIQIRYPKSLNFRIEFSPQEINTIGIHSNSLQLLVENAIKHNTFKDDNPLTIELYSEGSCICVKNQLRKKKQLSPSTGIGLENIGRRYELHGKKIEIDETDNYFLVKLPKIESSN